MADEETPFAKAMALERDDPVDNQLLYPLPLATTNVQWVADISAGYIYKDI